MFNLVEIQNTFVRRHVPSSTSQYSRSAIADLITFVFYPCKVHPCDETDEQERLFGSREADLGRVSMKLR